MPIIAKYYATVMSFLLLPEYGKNRFNLSFLETNMDEIQIIK